MSNVCSGNSTKVKKPEQLKQEQAIKEIEALETLCRARIQQDYELNRLSIVDDKSNTISRMDAPVTFMRLLVLDSQKTPEPTNEPTKSEEQKLIEQHDMLLNNILDSKSESGATESSDNSSFDENEQILAEAQAQERRFSSFSLSESGIPKSSDNSNESLDDASFRTLNSFEHSNRANTFSMLNFAGILEGNRRNKPSSKNSKYNKNMASEPARHKYGKK